MWADSFLEAIQEEEFDEVSRFILGGTEDLDVPNEDGISPLSLVDHRGFWPVKNLLLDHALFVATWKGQKDKVISLLDRGAEPNFIPHHVTHNREILDIIQKRMKRKAYLRKVRRERNKSEKLIKNFNEMRIDRIMENAVRKPRAASARKSLNIGLNETKFQDPPRPRNTRRNVPRRARSLNRKALLNLHNTLPKNKRIYKEDPLDRYNFENVVINEN
jgi:hypothetical protein